MRPGKGRGEEVGMRTFTGLLAAVFTTFALVAGTAAQEFDTKAKFALLMD
jgi:hypothetical protein